METGTEARDNRLFMVIALVLTGSLLLGLVGIGGLVAYRLFFTPTEVAMPPQGVTPTVGPVVTATPTRVVQPTATPTTAPTPTLVVPPGTGVSATPTPAGGDGQGSPGMSAPNSESSEMPETGFGLAGTLGIGAALASLAGGARAARRLRAR
jgi:cell division septation protein DedD